MSDPMLKAMDPGDLESMAAEVERLRAEIQEAARWRRIGEAELRTEIERLRARNAELVAALREYGMHKQDCERNETYGSEPCDCGYDAALAKAGGKE